MPAFPPANVCFTAAGCHLELAEVGDPGHEARGVPRGARQQRPPHLRHPLPIPPWIHHDNAIARTETETVVQMKLHLDWGDLCANSLPADFPEAQCTSFEARSPKVMSVIALYVHTVVPSQHQAAHSGQSQPCSPLDEGWAHGKGGGRPAASRRRWATRRRCRRPCRRSVEATSASRCALGGLAAALRDGGASRVTSTRSSPRTSRSLHCARAAGTAVLN